MEQDDVEELSSKQVAAGCCDELWRVDRVWAWTWGGDVGRRCVVGCVKGCGTERGCGGWEADQQLQATLAALRRVTGPEAKPLKVK